MPKFTIEHKTSHSAKDTYGKIKEFLNKDQEIRKFDSKLQCSFDDSQLSAQMNGSQFKANMKINEAQAGSNVVVTVDLPLMLTPFKGKVQETLQRKLEKYLG